MSTSKHEIYITVSTTYGLAKQLQQENYPFNQLFGHFIDQVALLAMNLGYDLPTTLGYIERSTCYNMDATFGSTRSKETFQSRISVRSEYLTTLYELSPYNHKTSMSLLFRTLLSMARIYGTSMVQLSYLVRSLNDGEMVIKSSKPSPKKSKPKRKSTKSETTCISISRKPKDKLDSVASLVEEKSPTVETAPVIEKSPTLETAPVVDTSPIVEDLPTSAIVEKISTLPVDNTESIHDTPQESSILVTDSDTKRDAQLDRATALLNRAKSLTEGGSVGKTVKTNPHLGDFF